MNLLILHYCSFEFPLNHSILSVIIILKYKKIKLLTLITLSFMRSRFSRISCPLSYPFVSHITFFWSAKAQKAKAQKVKDQPVCVRWLSTYITTGPSQIKMRCTETKAWLI